MVRIHPDPPLRRRSPSTGVGRPIDTRGCSSVGRAPALQAGGRRFDPVQLHQGWKALAPAGCRLLPPFLSVARRAQRSPVFLRWRGQRREAAPLFNNQEGKASMGLMRVRGR